jgi:hypothetical protein
VERRSRDTADIEEELVHAARQRMSMDPKLLHESPLTDFDTRGVEGVFEPKDVERLVQVLRDIEPRSAP